MPLALGEHAIGFADPNRFAGGNRTMNPRSYVDLKESNRALEPTYYFMINCLLYSRMETGLVSNQDFYDADVFRRLQNSTDARLKYAIYKTNADFLLVSIGIFDQPITPGQVEKMKPA